MARIFISQGSIDHWLGSGGVVLDGEQLHFQSLPGSSLFINPGVYFERIDGNDADPYDIVGSVKSAQELAQMGGDHYDNAVVLGEYAYTVKPGFIATPIGSDGSETMLDGGSWGQLLHAMESLGTPG